ncbi:MAG TPA: hypothetical protein PK559_13425, partial [Ignavibacteriaceae bacterium]|nr:hypothetical protein [Ignavibacteriaceae bacterium]
PSKNGNPLVVYGGINLGYLLNDAFRIDASLNYTHILKTEGKLGYDNYIFNNYISTKLGITFQY